MRTSTMLVLLFTLIFVGCNKIDGKLDELAERPAATTVEEAKALYDEVANLIRWHRRPENEKMSPEQAARAEALRDQRAEEMSALRKEELKEKVTEGVQWLKSIDLKGKIDWVLKDSVRMKKFGCPVGVDVTKEGASKLCP